MEITINGQVREYSGPQTLGELLCSLGINPKAVAVERNLRIIPKGEIETEPVASGDTFEIIRMVGGG